jgi:hypothetical protein
MKLIVRIKGYCTELFWRRRRSLRAEEVIWEWRKERPFKGVSEFEVFT